MLRFVPQPARPHQPTQIKSPIRKTDRAFYLREKNQLFKIGIHCLDAAVIVVNEFGHLDVPQMGFAARQLRVVVEQIPFTLVLHDGVVVGPAEYGGEDYAFVGVGAIEVFSHRIGDVVGVAGGIGEVILAVKFVDPGGFKKAAVAVGTEQWNTGAIQDLQVFGGLGKLQHIVAEPGDFGAECGFVTCRVFIFLNVAATGPALQLPAPDAAKHHVVGAVVIFKYRRVDAEAAFNRFGFGLEGTSGGIAGGYAHLENAVFVFCREIQKVFTVFFGRIGCPELAAGPGYVFQVQRFAVIGGGLGGRVVGEDAVILHIEFIAFAIGGDASFHIVRGVDVQLAVKHMG